MAEEHSVFEGVFEGALITPPPPTPEEQRLPAPRVDIVAVCVVYRQSQ